MPFNLRSLLDSMPDLYLILNTKFEILDMSKAYEQTTMIKREDVLHKNIFEVFPDNPNDQIATGTSNLRYSLEQVLKTKRAQPMAVQKYDIARPKEEGGGFEERYWSPVNIPCFDDNKEIIYIIHRAEDVTDFIKSKRNITDTPDGSNRIEQEVYRRAQEVQENSKKLIEYETSLRLMVENIRDYAIMMLDPKGNIVSWNLGAERIIGYKADEIIGKNFSLFYPEDAKNSGNPENELRVAKELGRYEEEGWRVKKDGTKFFANVIVTPVYNEKAHLIGYGKITQDLTEIKKIEKIKSEFVSVVSHELRTPLTSIRGSLGLLLGGVGGELTEKAKQLLTIANTNSERLSRLINDILDIEKISAGKMSFKFQHYDMSKLLQEVVANNQSYGEKFGVKIVSTHMLPNVYVNVDTDRLTQVIVNLISNAVKFSPAGKEVKVSMSLDEGKVKVSVRDEGPGIPDKFKEKIFQRFSQADSSTTRKEGGTGLGLAISKAIIEQLSGSIGFDSEEGKGSTFYFELPISVIKTEEDSKGTKLNGNRVLVCEDDEDQAIYISTMLQGAGYEVDISHTAAQTKRLLKERTYYALLLDLILPDMSGIDLIKELRSSMVEHSVPIIVVSIIAKESEHLFSGSALEVIDWLDKPIDFNKLSKAFSTIKHRVKARRPEILHVEDDPDVQEIIHNLLSDRAKITFAASVKESKDILTKKKFDLVILDLLLPDGNSTELLPLIAEKQTPVIVFSRGELDKKYMHFVNQVLIKSESSPAMLLNKIQAVLAGRV